MPQVLRLVQIRWLYDFEKRPFVRLAETGLCVREIVRTNIYQVTQTTDKISIENTN